MTGIQVSLNIFLKKLTKLQNILRFSKFNEGL